MRMAFCTARFMARRNETRRLLLGDRSGDKLGVQLGLADFNDVEAVPNR